VRREKTASHGRSLTILLKQPVTRVHWQIRHNSPYLVIVRLPRIAGLFRRFAPPVHGGPAPKAIYEEAYFRLRQRGAGCRRFCGWFYIGGQAATIKPYSWDLNPRPTRATISLAWGKSRGGRGSGVSSASAGTVSRRCSRTRTYGRRDDPRLLLTPREEFAAVNPAIHKRAYEHAFLDIGWGRDHVGPAICRHA